MVVLAEALQYLRTHGGRRALRRLFETYVSGRKRAYLLRSNYEALAAMPLDAQRLTFRWARPDDLAALAERFTHVQPRTFRTWLGPNYFLYVASDGDELVAFRCDSTMVSPWVRPILRLSPDQVFMVDIATAPAFRRQGITRQIRIAMAREMLHRGYRDSWGLQRPLNREALAAFDRTPDVIERFGTITRVSVLGRVRFSLTPSRWLSADHIVTFTQLVADLVPGVSRVALLFNPGTTIATPGALEAVTRAAAKVGIDLVVSAVTEAEDQVRAFSNEFAEIARRDAAAAIVLDDPMYRDHRHTIAGLARRHRIPTIYEGRGFVTAGGLMAYVRPSPPPTTLPAELRARAISLDSLGGSPGLTINLKTAKALHLAVPRSLLLRADHVME